MAGPAADAPAALLAGVAVAGTQQRRGGTFWPCVANLSKVIIGAGMMAIPQAFYRIGSLAGSSMLVLVGVMTYTTLVFLLRGSAATGATTYSQLTRVLCGAAIMKVLQVAVLSFCFGFGVVYLVIIRDILLGTPPACNGLLCELLGLPPSSVLADPRLVIVALAVLVCAPLLLLRTMDRLAILNVVGVGAIALLALTALGLAVQGLAGGTAHPVPLWPQWQQLGQTTAQQVQALMAVMPVMIACYVAHQSLHPLMPLLKPYSDARMRGVTALALLIAFAVFGSLAVGSGLAFGPDLQVNVLSNFSVMGLEPMTGPFLARLLSWAIRGGYLLSLLASLLLYMHPLRSCLAEMAWPDATAAADTAADTRNVQHVQQAEESAGLLANPAQTQQMQGPVPQTSVKGLDSSSRGQVLAGDGDYMQGQPDPASIGAKKQQQQRGSAFAAPAGQAAAAAAAAAGDHAGVEQQLQGDGGGGSSRSSSGQVQVDATRQLSTFDSFDNPRTGSWSSVKYLPPQQPDPGNSSSTGSSGRHCSMPGLTSSQRQPQQQQQWLPAPLEQQHAQAVAAGQQAGVSYVRDGVQICVTEEGAAATATGAPRQQQQQPGGLLWQQQQQHRWQEAEQRWYYHLTYALLAAMVVVAVAVPNIWTALSAIGDLASTLQAFVVPGVIGIMLATQQHKLKPTSGDSRSSGVLQERMRCIANGGVGVVAVLLGAVLFANGIYQRL